MPSKIVLYNPHVDDFLAEPLHFRFLRRKSLKKYGFLIDALKNEQGEVSVIIDGTESSFISSHYFCLIPNILRKLFSYIEYVLWLKINNFTKFNRINPNASDLSSYTLLAFSYKAAIGNFEPRVSLFPKFKHVVFHLSHYFVRTSEKVENIKKIPNAWLAGDSDLSRNAYFNFFFGFYQKQFLALPFAVKSRFINSATFINRDLHCVATGSLHDLHKERPSEAYVDYMLHSGLDNYHPLRKQVYESRNQIKDVVTCLVSPYRNYQTRLRFNGWVDHFFVSQKNYFSIDIVQVYNHFMFAVVGEEASGFPALGMFEAMACGCVVFADPKKLRGLNLKANKHYLSYDGSLDGLLKVLDFAKKRTDLESISIAGQKVVSDFFTEKKVGLLWVEELQSLI